MGLTANDIETYVRADDVDERRRDGLAVLSVDVETDAVDAIRDVRERM